MALAERVQGWADCTDHTLRGCGAHQAEGLGVQGITALWRERGTVGRQGALKTHSVCLTVCGRSASNQGPGGSIPLTADGAQSAGAWLPPRPPSQGPCLGSALALLLPSPFLLLQPVEFSAEMYYFSKHRKQNNFLQPQGIWAADEEWGLLLGEEGGLRLPGVGGGGDRMSKTH